MDFEDYALAGLGTAGGLALGAKDIGQRIGHKWGEQGYYRSKAASLGNQSDAFVDYDREAEKIANSDLPQKLQLRELQKLKSKREQIVGKSVQNMEIDAQNSRGWNRGKGVVAGTLGTAAIGGALGLGYGLSNNFSKKVSVAKFSRKRDSTYVQFKQAYTKAVANFEYGAMSPEEFKGDLFGLGVGTLAGSEVGRAFATKTKANALRRSADPNERHNQMLTAQLEAAQQIQDPRQRAAFISKAQSQADYESAKIQRVAGLKGFGQQALGVGLGVGAGYGGVLANTMANHWEQL